MPRAAALDGGNAGKEEIRELGKVSSKIQGAGSGGRGRQPSKVTN